VKFQYGNDSISFIPKDAGRLFPGFCHRFHLISQYCQT
jgi:hypothetical protein